ncbi:unnamed protein product [Rhizoctonia solani]|uniref:Uncharacterized protein n=1 Tax=Rhizoctonia solani TaxID=456999 RepID=A0A8H3DDU1_9AGAM|nr:unnamed protein product [Rhizoctonia solani]
MFYRLWLVATSEGPHNPPISTATKIGDQAHGTESEKDGRVMEGVQDTYVAVDQTSAMPAEDWIIVTDPLDDICLTPTFEVFRATMNK